MKTYYQQKYRIPSNRLQGYDYSTDGAYFITGCTWNLIHYLGEIYEERNEIELTTAGKILEEEWYKTPEIRKEISLGAFQVMPNHFHGIIIIGSPNLPEKLSAHERYVPQTPGYKNEFGKQVKTLGRMLGGMKGAITKRIHNSGFKTFNWQSNFNDHIIRDMDEYRRCTYYIQNNVRTWRQDKFFS